MLAMTGRSTQRSRVRPALLAVLASVCAASPLRSERLDFRSYGAAEGLAHPRVISIARDARGVLWIGTWEGLCRFDGREFTHYGVREGLANPLVIAVAEDASGRLWFATHGAGLARFAEDPAGGEVARPAAASADRPALVCFAPAASIGASIVASLACDATGRLWCATEAGFYRAELDAAGAPTFASVLGEQARSEPGLCFIDAAGRAVLLRSAELLRADGLALTRFPRAREPELGALVAVARAGEHLWLVAHSQGLLECELSDDLREPPLWRRTSLALPAGARITALARAPGGVTWIGTTRGLIRRDAQGERLIGAAQGLADESIASLCAPVGGSLWIGTRTAGLHRLGDETVVRFEVPNAAGSLAFSRVIEGGDGAIYASSEDRGLYRVEEGALRLVPGSDAPPFATAHLRVACDRRGAWWIGTELGLFRAPGPEPDLARAERVWPAAGEPPRRVFGEVRQEGAERIWFSGDDYAVYTIGCEELDLRVTRIESELVRSPVRVALTDRFGADWYATFDELLRRRGARFELVEGAVGLPLPPSRPRALLEDSSGRLWVGLRFDGLRVCDDPAAEEPRLRAYTSADGLPSEAVLSLAEDARGRILVATGRGLARFDPALHSWRSPIDAGGFGGQVVSHVLCDEAGSVWAASSGGLLRLGPQEDSPGGAPGILVRRVSLGGRALAIAERGATRVRGVTVPASRRDVVLEYAGVDLDHGERLRYQHRLAGADADWSPPTERAAVHYPRLAPGRYLFEVRALDALGRTSPAPAVVELDVQAPVWRRAWFLALVAGALFALAYALHRARLNRALALERVRAQIATDLHDDLGAGLAQIAILSEVARRGADPRLSAALGELAELARSMRESMAEIVWAIDPRRDTLLDLVRRMRQVSANLLEASGVEVDFRAPADERVDAVGLSPQERRQLLYLFKEAATNVARHAQAARAEVCVELEGRRLRVRVRDDGRGFDPNAHHAGQGLASMRRRAESLGGTLRLRSARGEGAELELELALRGRAR